MSAAAGLTLAMPPNPPEELEKKKRKSPGDKPAPGDEFAALASATDPDQDAADEAELRVSEALARNVREADAAAAPEAFGPDEQEMNGRDGACPVSAGIAATVAPSTE